MARPINTTRRQATLAKAADYVLEHGLAGLSLRPLAKAVGTSPRMLLYDFESKEQLVAEILAEIRRRETSLLEADVRTLEEVWRWISAPEREPFLRLFYETYLAGAASGRSAPLVREWLDFLQTSWHPRTDEATATLIVAVIRGLLLDVLATGDRARADAALRLFASSRSLPASPASAGGRAGTARRTRRRSGDGRT